MDEVNVNRLLRVIEGAWGRLGDDRVVFYSRWLARLGGDPAAVEAAILRLAETEQRLPSVATLRQALGGSIGTPRFGDHDPAVIGPMIASIRELAADLGRQRDQDWRVALASIYLAEQTFASYPGSAEEAGLHRDRAEAARRILVEEGEVLRWTTAAIEDNRAYRRQVAWGGIRRILDHDPGKLEGYLMRSGNLFTAEEIEAMRAEAAR